MTSRRWLMVVLGAAAVLLIAGRALAGAYADYLWYESLGAVALWRMRAKQTMLLEVGIGAWRGAIRLRESVRGSPIGCAARLPAAHWRHRDRRRSVGTVFDRRHVWSCPRFSAWCSRCPGLVDHVLHLRAPDDCFMRPTLHQLGSQLFRVLAALREPPLELGIHRHCRHWRSCHSSLCATPSLKWERRRFEASGYVKRHLTVLAGVVLLMAAGASDSTCTRSSSTVPGSTAPSATSTIGLESPAICSFRRNVRRRGDRALGGLRGAVPTRRHLDAQRHRARVGCPRGRPLIAEHTGTDSERSLRELPYVATRAAYTRRAFGVAQPSERRQRYRVPVAGRGTALGSGLGPDRPGARG